jgi:transposase
MGTRSRRTHLENFMASAAMAALSGDRTLIEIAEQSDAFPIQVIEWKRELLERPCFPMSVGKGIAYKPPRVMA